MNNPESVKIVSRFYEAINLLINQGNLKSKRAFAMNNDIEYTSFSRCEYEKESDRFQLVWIKYLVTQYPISLQWIMLDEGVMLAKKKDGN
jgi:hypothetical protein